MTPEWPDRRTLAGWRVPVERRLLSVGIVVGSYVLLFPILHQFLDHYYFILGLVPITVGAFLLGLRGAVVVVIIVSLAHFTILAGPLDTPTGEAFLESFPVITLLIGVSIGYLRDLRVENVQQRRELEATNERIRREQALKDTIRTMLVDLSDRSELEQSFCDRIADDGYPLVCLCDRTTTGRVVVRRTTNTSGIADDEPTFLGMSDAPPATALVEGRTVSIDDVDDVDSAWATAAADDGIRSLLAIPLRHNNLGYGVLCVCDGDPSSFGRRAREVLVDIADTMAYAIHDLDRRESLRSDQQIEVTLSVDGSDSYLPHLAGHDRLPSDGEIGVLDTRETSDGSVVHSLVVDGADPTVVKEIVDDHDGVDGVRIDHVSSEGERATLTVTLPPPTIVDAFVDVGGAVRSVTVSPDGVTVVARFGRDVDLGAIVETLRSRLPGTELVSKTRVGPNVAVPGSSLEDRLTEKQLEALRIAYVHGFFERPQGRTAEELASMLGVSRPTFLTHVRAAEERLVGDFVRRYSTIERPDASGND